MCKYTFQPLYMYVKQSVSLCMHVYFSIHGCMSIQCVSMSIQGVSMSIQWVSMSIQCVSMSIQCISMSIQCVNMLIHCVRVYPCVSNQPSFSIETNSPCAHCPSTYINTYARSIGMYQYCHPPPTWQGLTGAKHYMCRGSKAGFWIYLFLRVGMIKFLGYGYEHFNKKKKTCLHVHIVLYDYVHFFSLSQNREILVQLLTFML